MAVICISRQFGAGGKTLAERLAKRLGYDMTDQELVSRAAKETGHADEWVDTTGREVGLTKGFTASLTSSNFMARLLGQPGADDNTIKLAELFKKYIPEIAARDKVIFLGRGSQFILPNGPPYLKILLVASDETRVNFMMKTYNLDRNEAEKVIRDWEKNRSAFLCRFTSKDHNDPSLYDLVINASVVNLDLAEKLTADLVTSRDVA